MFSMDMIIGLVTGVLLSVTIFSLIGFFTGVLLSVTISSLVEPTNRDGE